MIPKMNRKISFLLLLVIYSAPGLSRIVKDEVIKIELGEELDLLSPGYPDVPPAGTRLTWQISSDSRTNILLNCPDVRISPTPECEKGYFSVNDGLKEQKFCGSEVGLFRQSFANTMKLEFDLTWASGLFECKIKAVKEEKVVSDNKVDEGTIFLEPDGSAFDLLYEDIGNTVMKWRFETSKRNKISLVCYHVRLPQCNDATDYFQINTGSRVVKLCDQQSTNTRLALSDFNELSIVLNAKRDANYKLNCIVGAVSSTRNFEFMNVVSMEIGSSERGSRPGSKKTNCNCGWSVKSPARIVNGDEVRLGQYPWMASLLHQGHHMCGGSIVTEYHVLTAAHCTSSRKAENFQVLVGTTNNTSAGRGQRIQVQKIIEGDYIGDYNVNDIAMLVLAEKVRFNDFVGPVCLTAERVYFNNKYLTTMGWGNLGEEGEWRYPQQLMRAHVRGVDYNTCNFLYNRKFKAPEPDRLCIWASNRDACYGDSGGPVVWLDPEINRYVAMGIASMGYGCNTDFPKVYAYVPYHIDWIQKTIQGSMPNLQICGKV